MQELFERCLGRQDTPEMHVPRDQGIYRKKQSSLSEILNLFSSSLVTKIRRNNLKENCLNLLSAERWGIFLNIFFHWPISGLGLGWWRWLPMSKKYAQALIFKGTDLLPRPVYITLYYKAISVSGKVNQILRCDWLTERARWSYLARSGPPAVFKQISPKAIS